MFFTISLIVFIFPMVVTCVKFSMPRSYSDRASSRILRVPEPGSRTRRRSDVSSKRLRGHFFKLVMPAADGNKAVSDKWGMAVQMTGIIPFQNGEINLAGIQLLQK